MKFKRIVLLLSFSLRDYRSWNDIEKEKKKNIYIYFIIFKISKSFFVGSSIFIKIFVARFIYDIVSRITAS